MTYLQPWMNKAAEAFPQDEFEEAVYEGLQDYIYEFSYDGKRMKICAFAIPITYLCAYLKDPNLPTRHRNNFKFIVDYFWKDTTRCKKFPLFANGEVFMDQDPEAQDFLKKMREYENKSQAEGKVPDTVWPELPLSYAEAEAAKKKAAVQTKRAAPEPKKTTAPPKPVASGVASKPASAQKSAPVQKPKAASTENTDGKKNAKPASILGQMVEDSKKQFRNIGKEVKKNLKNMFGSFFKK